MVRGVTTKLTLSAVLCVTAACASNGKKKSNPDRLDNSKDSSSSKSSKASNQEDDLDVSGKYRPFFSSIENRGLSSKPVSRSSAEGLARSLESITKSDPNDRDNFLALMAARRLAGQGLGPVMRAATRLADIEMRKNIDRSIPAVAKLEIALTAVANKKYSMAEHFLPDLVDNKNSGIAAAALNLEGLMEFADGRVPEAVNTWLKARKKVKNYQPATMNLAMIALKYGAHKFASSMVADLNDDWLVLVARAASMRLDGKAKAAADICGQALSKQRNKISLFNCAVAADDAGDGAKARRLLSEASSARGNLPGFDRSVSSFKASLGSKRSGGSGSNGGSKKGKK